MYIAVLLLLLSPVCCPLDRFKVCTTKCHCMASVHGCITFLFYYAATLLANVALS